MFEGRYAGGTIRANIKLKGNVIDRICFDGDFFCKKSIEELESKFLELTIDENLLTKLEDIHVEDYFLNINSKDIYNLLHENSER